MADLSQLMQVAPISAAGFMGINQADNEQAHQQKMMELAELMQQRKMQEARAAEQHPLLMQAKQLGLQRDQAELPGVLARSQRDQLTLETERAQQPGKMMDASGQLIGKTFERLGQLAPVISDPSELEGALSELQVPPKVRQMMMAKLGNLRGPALQKELARISENYFRSNPDYVKTMDKEKLEQEGATNRTRMTNESAERRVKTSADGRKKAEVDAAKQWETAVIKAKGAKAQHAAAVAASTWFQNNGMPAQAAQFAAVAAELRPQAEAEIAQSQPPAGKINMGAQTGLPVNPNRSIAPPGAAAQKPAPAASGARVQVQGPDGKLYSLPASQLQQAEKQGYKRIQ